MSSLALLSFSVLAFGFGIMPEAAGQASMQTILTNGPISNRLNVVVLSGATPAPSSLSSSWTQPTR